MRKTEFFENIRVCSKTDIGHRKENEDRYLIVDGSKKDYNTRSHGMMFAVADGVSGHSAGATASRMACNGLLDYYVEKIDVRKTNIPESMLMLLEQVIRNTHLEIQRFSEMNKGYDNMATTLSMLVLVKNVALLAHVGDSRIYRFSHDCLEQLTEDHTVAQLSVEMGYLKPEEVNKNPLQHALTQALGDGLDEIQTRIEKVNVGDVFILCSDGLHNVVSDDEIGMILSKNPAHTDACDQLVQTALGKGGKDNVTVIVVWV